MTNAIVEYITKRIETEYRLEGKDKAKEYYDSYFNQDNYKAIKKDVDKQLIEKKYLF